MSDSPVTKPSRTPPATASKSADDAVGRQAGMGKGGEPPRCPWCLGDPIYVAYHDTEWGVPVHDDRHLFELLILEGAQAGLSWLTVLRKRARYREVYDGFDPQKVAGYGAERLAAQRQDAGIIRNRLKLSAAVDNARAFVEVQAKHGTFDRFLWDFVDGVPIRNHWRSPGEVPATSGLSDTLSRELKRRGFRFVGSTICYAYLQAAGLVNDHLVSCFRHRETTID